MILFVSVWLENDKQCVTKAAMVIYNVATKEPIERWEFIVNYDHEEDSGDNITSDKAVTQIQKEIRDVLKQIVSTIAILPPLDCTASFNVHIHTVNDIPVPEQWDEINRADIIGAQTVPLHSFDTGLHKLNTNVSYKITT